MGDKKRGNKEAKKPKQRSDGTKKQKKDPKRYDGPPTKQSFICRSLREIRSVERNISHHEYLPIIIYNFGK